MRHIIDLKPSTAASEKRIKQFYEENRDSNVKVRPRDQICQAIQNSKFFYFSRIDEIIGCGGLFVYDEIGAAEIGATLIVKKNLGLHKILIAARLLNFAISESPSDRLFAICQNDSVTELNLLKCGLVKARPSLEIMRFRSNVLGIHSKNFSYLEIQKSKIPRKIYDLSFGVPKILRRDKQNNEQFLINIQIFPMPIATAQTAQPLLKDCG